MLLGWEDLDMLVLEQHKLVCLDLCPLRVSSLLKGSKRQIGVH